MIIFTVTSIISGQVYIGTTRNDLESQWEKMVAAAQQDMDYPLYREIRIHGEDEFTVEEWDRAEDRSEMMELEEEAISHFNAKSLRGYKTSTVKILPKKKKRQRKSSIEKELVTIFAEADDNDSNIIAPSLAIKSEAASETAPKANKPAASAQASPAVSAASESKPAAASKTSAKELFQLAVAELESEAKAEEKPAENKVEEPQSGGSQANAVVQMTSIDLGDDISAQLAAITAAADAVLAGDNGAATEQLEVAQQQKVEAEEEATPLEVVATPAVEKEVVVEVPVCPKELRIREAIERHRKQRAQISSEAVESIKNQIASILSELDARARQLHTGNLAQVA
ncbi:MAG: GIY-YIG nuclease family protein [Endozoicomonas sp.]